MRKHWKRMTAFILAAMSVLGLLTACGGGGGSSSATTFSWWMASAENASYYTDYDENPVINYIKKFKTFEDSNGEQVHIDFDFQAGVTGSEQDNFNNMMTTGTYTDVIDPTYYSGSLVDLYDAGTVLDMTEYVEQYMPNYLAYKEAHPELERYFTTNVNGEEKYLTIPAVYESLDMYDQWYGYEYRRDWIVKYGVQPDTLYDPRTDSAPTANPNAGKAFSGYYTLDKDGNAINEPVCGENINGDSWTDDVIFPSGHSDPVYVSDWEWMLDIFAKALAAEGITDGYCTTVFYPGYLAVGDLVSGFGGIGPLWYIDDNGQCQFGAVSEGFKAYLTCMNNWYNKGWLDQRFDQRSSDSFYMIDDTTVRQGKVGIWVGTPSELLSRMQNDSLPTTNGIVVYTCASPINDVYGPAEVQMTEPICIFSPEMIAGGIAVTDKAKDKDLKVLCEYMDYLFTEEGILLMNGGLNEEQAKEANDPIYQAYGIDYAYTPVTGEDGQTKIEFVDTLYVDEGGIRSAMTGQKAWHLTATARYVRKDTDTFTHQMENWVTYDAPGTIAGMLNSRLSVEDMAVFQKVNSRIGTEYMYVEVPKFITGEHNLEGDWDAFVADLGKRDYQSVTDAYNRALGN